MVVCGITHKRVDARTELGKVVAITNSKNIKKGVGMRARACVYKKNVCREIGNKRNEISYILS